MLVCEICVELFLSGVWGCACLLEGCSFNDHWVPPLFAFQRERAVFVVCRGVCSVVGYLGGEEQECLEVWIGILVSCGPWWGSMFSFELLFRKFFCNYSLGNIVLGWKPFLSGAFLRLIFCMSYCFIFCQWKYIYIYALSLSITVYFWELVKLRPYLNKIYSIDCTVQVSIL